MFSYAGHRSIDPNELETKLSTEEGVCWLDFLVDDEPSEEKQEQLERIQTLLDDLPPMEADYVDLYYYRRKKQTDIADMFGVSQPTVCYRLQRAAARIQFLLSLPPISEKEVESTMRKFLTEEIDVRIMVQMLKTTCQSEVAKRLKVSQGLVRHRFIRAIEKMRDAKEYENGCRYKVYRPETDVWEYVETFEDAQDLIGSLVEALELAGKPAGAEVELESPAEGDAEATVEADSMFPAGDSLDLLMEDGTPKSWAEYLKQKGVKNPPKLAEIPRMSPQIGKFYEIYAAISSNLNILRDVRRKTPEQEVQLIVW